MDLRARRGRGSSATQVIFTVGLLVVFLGVVIAAGVFVYNEVYDWRLDDNWLPSLTIDGGSEDVGYAPGQPLPRWEGTDRVNVLLMGIDQREHEQGPWRTDTLLVLTVDPVTLSGGMLSIPRDLWVPIHGGYDMARINTAHYIGEISDYPGGGPELAARTVQDNIGVHIHYYARINFAAFEELVDLIGGIDVYVEEEISDPYYPDEAYGYDPLYLPAGWQHLNGEMALKYARTRHSAGGDFDRARRQQQVLTAVYEQVTRLDLLPQLLPRATEFWEALQGAVVTNMTLDEIVALARLASDVDPDTIRYGVVDESYTQFWETPDGQQVLVPLREPMRQLRDYVFTSAPAVPEGEGPAARLASEAATIEVLNGTTAVGLAGQTSEYLELQGLQILYTGNADRSDYAESLIIVYTGKNYTAEYVAGLLGLPPTAVVHGSFSGTAYDVSVILGADYQAPELQP